MATKKRKRSRRRLATSSIRRTPKRTKGKKRRRMGAGNQVFKFLSDPFIGGVTGALTGMLLRKLLNKIPLQKMSPGMTVAGPPNNMMQTALNVGVPLLVAFAVRKKVPFVSAGIVAGASIPQAIKIFPALAEDNRYVNQHLLSSGQPILLSADGQPILMSESGKGRMGDYGRLNYSMR